LTARLSVGTVRLRRSACYVVRVISRRLLAGVLSLGALALFPGVSAAFDIPSPLSRGAPPGLRTAAVPDAGSELGLFLRPEALHTLRNLRPNEETVLRGFPLAASVSADLALRRFDLFAPDARSVEKGPGGVETIAAVPDAAFFEGTVDGDPESRVFLSAFGASVRGFVQRGEETFAFEPRGRWESETPEHVVRRLSRAQWTALAGSWRCDAERLAAPPSREAFRSASLADMGQPYVATLAVDTDFELFRQFPNSTAERNYVSNALAAVSAIYWRDLKTRLVVGSLRVWTSASDPWAATTSIDALYEVGSYWHANGSAVSRSTVLFLSGKNLGGGVAWISTICQGDTSDGSGHWAGGYAIVGNIDQGVTNFHHPAPGSDVWDIDAIAHELGHNFGSDHTHCYSPPIDECYGKEPGCYSGPNVDAGAGVGTIMSYCQLFGWSEVSLKFHPRCVSEQLRPTIVNAASLDPACMAGATFSDVSSTDVAASAIGTMAAWGIMPGCTATTFCPLRIVTRADMAVFIERSLNVFVPPAGLPPIFGDVAPGAYAYDFIGDFSRRGITNGCTATAYCPSSGISRAQMAVFLLRAEHGAAYVPPPATGTMFSDVAGGGFAAWIEQLAREQITLGCGGGRFCPGGTVSRSQMALFLSRTLHF